MNTLHKPLTHCCKDCLMYDKGCVLTNNTYPKGDIIFPSHSSIKTHKSYSRHPEKINNCIDWQN